MLGADLFRTDATWHNHRSARDLAEALGEQLTVEQVALQDLVPFILLEQLVDHRSVDLLAGFEQESILIERHLNHMDVVHLAQSRHEVAESHVECAPSAGGDDVGRHRRGDDLLEHDAIVARHLNRIDGVLLEESCERLGDRFGQCIGTGQQQTRIATSSDRCHRGIEQIENGGGQLTAAARHFTRPRGHRGPISGDRGHADAAGLDTVNSIGRATKKENIATSEILNEGG